MKRKLQGLGFAALLALMWNAGVAYGQTAEATTKPTIPLRYDINKEVTLSATVQRVPAKSTGMQLQSASNMDLVLQTTSGVVQGRLTPFALSGKNGLSVKEGQQIQVTGVMTTMKNNKQEFVIRTIEIGGRTYAIRDQRGFPLEHPALNTSVEAVSKGGQL